MLKFTNNIILISSITTVTVAGEVTTDGSMGAAQTLTGPNYTIGQDLGATVGNNLFHSFGTFNLNQGDVATFTGADTIQNVISRVTEGNPSSINGTIQSQVGNANFFFINPAGVVFGEHAAVNVPADFHVSTAQELRFADGSAYNLVTPKANLTAAPPEAFGFLGRTGDIKIENGNLVFQEGTNVTFAGGAVTASNSNITVPRGSLRVYGNGDTVGNVPINGELPAGNGAVVIDGSELTVSGNGGGNISISGGAVSVVYAAHLYNDNSGNPNAGGSTRIDANSLLIDNSEISNSGNVIIHAESLIMSGGIKDADDVVITVAGDMQMGGYIDSDGSVTINTKNLIMSGSIKDADDVIITVAGDMLMEERGYIDSDGSVTISAANLIMLGRIEDSDDVIITVAGDMLMEERGYIDSDGSVTISAENLIMSGYIKGDDVVINVSGDMQTGGYISNDGSVTISAGSLSIFDGGILVPDNVVITVAGNMQVGEEGIIHSDSNVTISAENLNILGPISPDGDAVITVAGDMYILDEGYIWSDSDVTINARNLTIDKQGSNHFFTGIHAVDNITITVPGDLQINNHGEIEADDYGEVVINVGGDMQLLNYGKITSRGLWRGDGGSVEITVAGHLQILDGGQILGSAHTHGGEGGSVTVNAGSLTIDGQGRGQTILLGTGISAIAFFYGALGGDIVINVAGEMRILNGGHVSSGTVAHGDAGSVIINAGNLTIDHQQGSSYFTGITSQANVDMVDPGGESFDTTGDAGIVIINVAGEMQVLNGGQISNANYGSGNAGTITITANGLLFLDDGIITNSAQTGTGGDITITAPAIVLNNSQITTSVLGAGKDGGDITLNGGYLVLDTGFIQANTVGDEAKGGDIFVNMDGVLPNGGVTEVGGDHATFNRNSGRNVIQAAANATENDGTITITNPSDSSAAGLTGAANRLEPIQIAKNPCIGIKKRASLRRKGRGGLLKSSLKSNLLKTNDYAPNSKDVAHTNRKQRQQEVCAEG